LIRSFTGKLAANLLNGAAFSFFSYFLFSQALLFTRLPGMVTAQTFYNNVSHLAIPAVLFFAGLTIFNIAKLLTNSARERLISPATAAGGQVIIGCGLWQSLAAFSPSWSPANNIGLIFFAALLASAISNLGSYGENSSNPVLADASKWLKDGPAGKFFLGGMVAAYLIFIRPAIFSVFPYSYLIEWLIFCFLSWRIFSGVRGSLQKRYSIPLKDSTWQKHIQKVNNLMDEDFTKLVILQKDYVDTGFRRDLLEYLKQILLKNGMPDDEISRTLSLIIEQNDLKAPWYLFGLLKRRISRQNRQNRIKSLDNTILRLSAISHPSRQ